jgi:TorA maturation chaperone TorD
MPTAINSELADLAIQRANRYVFFAQAFAHPTAERKQQLDEAAAQLLVDGGNLGLMRLAAIARETQSDALEPLYVSLTTFSASPDCPTFETAYYGDGAQQQTHRMADIAGFYRAFGVDGTEGGFRPDDLSVELEFMAFLCEKEAFARLHLGAARTAQALRAQRLFLQEHLGTWAPRFAASLSEVAPYGHFYWAAGNELAAWIQAECTRTGANPVAVPVERPVAAPLPVSHGPEFPGDASFVSLEELAVR